MKRIISLLGLTIVSIFFCTGNATAQWMKVGSNFGGIIQCFASSGSNIFVGTDGNYAFVSSDGGVSWTQLNTGLGNKHVQALIASGIYLFAGTSGGVYVSSNSGTTWFPQNTGLGTAAIVHAIITSGGSVTIGTSNGVYRSKSFSSWEKIDTGMVSDFYVNTFIQSDTNLLAGAFDFGVWRSTDNGSHWDQSNSGMTKSDIHAFAEYKGRLYAATDGAALFASNDNGHTWFESGLGGFSASSLNTLLFKGSDLLIGSDIGVLLNSDIGLSWNDLSNGLTNRDVRLLFINGGFAFAAIGDSSVWRRPVSELAVHQGISESISAANYPNPFSEKTTITFTSSQHGFTEVNIMNILGEEVAKLFSGELEAGDHSFTWNAKNVPAGMYECEVRTGKNIYTIPLVVKN